MNKEFLTTIFSNNRPPEMRSQFDNSGDLYNLGLILLDMCNNMENRKTSHYNATYKHNE